MSKPWAHSNRIAVAVQRGLRLVWSWREEIAIFCLFVGLTIVVTWPYARFFRTRIPDVGIDDPIEVARFIKNFHDWVFGRRPGGLFDFDIYFPHPLAGTSTDPLFGAGLLTLPLRLFTSDYLFIINVALFITFPLTAHATYLLVRELTRSRGAGVVAGVSFSFCFYRMHQLDHVNVLTMQWLPYALTYLHRIQHHPTWKNAGLLCLFVYANCAASVNIGLYSALLFPIVGTTVILAARRGSRLRCGMHIVAAGLLAAIMLIPIYRPFILAAEIGTPPTRQLWEVLQYSGRIENFFAAPPWSAVYPERVGLGSNESPMFIGFSVLALAAVGTFWYGRAARRLPMKWSRYLYLALALSTALVCLGPEVRFKNCVVGKGIWSILTKIPAYTAVRTPARFYFITCMCVAILAGAGCAVVFARARSKWIRFLLFGTVVTGILLELRVAPIPMRPVVTFDQAPPVYRVLATAPHPGEAVVELPESWDQSMRTRMFHAMIHGRPTVDDTSSYSLYYFWMMEDERLRGDTGLQTIAEVHAAGLRYVALRLDAINAEQYQRYVSLISSVGAKSWGKIGNHELFELSDPPKTVTIEPERVAIAVVPGADTPQAPSGTTVRLEVIFTSKVDDFIFERGPRWLDLDIYIEVPTRGVAHRRLSIGLAPALIAPHKSQDLVRKYLALDLPPGNYRTTYRMHVGDTSWAEGSLTVPVSPPKE